MYKNEHDVVTKNEGKYINLSLHYLEQVILSLHPHAKSKVPMRHIPYRNSMLTSVLRDSLGGNCRTVFIVTLNPELKYTNESISSCRFAAVQKTSLNNLYYCTMCGSFYIYYIHHVFLALFWSDTKS